MDLITSKNPSASAESMDAGPIFTAPADIIGKPNAVVMALDLPGADPESLDITLEKRVLSLSARVTTSAPQGYAPTHIEFRDGTYERSFVFSEQMDDDHIDATLKDGVLRLTVPKVADSAAKKIVVKSN